MKSIASLGQGGEKQNHLDAKPRELISLAAAVTTRCDGCIAFHAGEAKKAGSTVGELSEAHGTAINLNAGAAPVYSARTLDAFSKAWLVTENYLRQSSSQAMGLALARRQENGAGRESCRFHYPHRQRKALYVFTVSSRMLSAMPLTSFSKKRRRVVPGIARGLLLFLRPIRGRNRFRITSKNALD